MRTLRTNSSLGRLLAIGGCILLPALGLLGPPAAALEPIPERLVVLTFDDSVKSHYTVARSVLKEYGFGATFFVTEGFTFKTNKTDYMTWEEIRSLHGDGFEIGNHTRDHMGVNAENVGQLEEQLRGIEEQCQQVGIPKPVSFAWPGNVIAREALPVLGRHGIVFARRGGSPEYPREEGYGFAYEPGKDHPYLIPSAAVPRPGWTLATFVEAVKKSGGGRIAVIQFHGVPEGEHPWVHTPRELFLECMKYLRDHHYQVIAMRDLSRYVDPAQTPSDPWKVIELRQKLLSGKR